MTSQLDNLGVPWIVDPLLSVISSQCPSMERVQTLILTSHRALDCVEKFLPNIRVFCVGSTLKDRLIEKGLEVFSFSSVSCLLERICSLSPADLGSILYLRGEVITIDIEKILLPLEYQIISHIVYKTRPAASLNSKTIEAFKQGAIRYVCFFSKKTAEIFMKLMKIHKLESLYPTLTVFSFSSSISMTLSGVPLGAIFTTASPSMNSFWNLVRNHVE